MHVFITVTLMGTTWSKPENRWQGKHPVHYTRFLSRGFDRSHFSLRQPPTEGQDIDVMASGEPLFLTVDRIRHHRDGSVEYLVTYDMTWGNLTTPQARTTRDRKAQELWEQLKKARYKLPPIYPRPS